MNEPQLGYAESWRTHMHWQSLQSFQLVICTFGSCPRSGTRCLLSICMMHHLFYAELLPLNCRRRKGRASWMWIRQACIDQSHGRHEMRLIRYWHSFGSSMTISPMMSCGVPPRRSLLFSRMRASRCAIVALREAFACWCRATLAKTPSEPTFEVQTMSLSPWIVHLHPWMVVWSLQRMLHAIACALTAHAGPSNTCDLQTLS